MVSRTLMTTLQVAAATTAIAVLLSSCSAAAEDGAVTRQQLRHGWPQTERSEILLPLRLPETERSIDGPAMDLVNVATDRDVRPENRVWVTYFDVPAFDDPGVRIFQRPAGQRGKACGPMGDVPHLDRRVAGSDITICSKKLDSHDAERRYWQDVPFVADLGRIAWLDEG